MLLSKKLFIEFFPSFCEKSNDEIEKMLNAKNRKFMCCWNNWM